MARGLEGIYRKSLDADSERDVEKEGIRSGADKDYDIIEKEERAAELFEREEKIRKDAQAFTDKMNLLNTMSKEELESKRVNVLKLEKLGIYTWFEAYEEIEQLDKRIIKFLDGMSKEELEGERHKLFGFEENPKFDSRLRYELDKRIKEAERLEEEQLNETNQDRTVDYTGPLASFMAPTRESQTISEHTTQQTSSLDYFNPFVSGNRENRQQLESELLEEFKNAKHKEVEIEKIDKATHGLEELAKGHEIDKDKGDRDF